MASSEVLVNITDLKITNPNLDESYVSAIVDEIISGAPTIAETIKPYVIKLGQEYLVYDGNHHVSAYRRAGVASVVCDLHIGAY